MTVYGTQYFAGACRDVVSAGEPLPSAQPAATVVLSLCTSDGATADVARAHPDRDASFAVTFEIPAAAPLGPATLVDRDGHGIELVVAP